ncbi:hypothetical protein P7C73_g5603, partial [Tremellales sp. Uapishka_1]
MSNVGALTTPPSMPDDDDWETAEFEPKASHNPVTLATPIPALRPSAPEFKPRPTASPKIEDEWFRGEPAQQSNRQIWDTANTSLPPTLIVPTITTNTTSAIPPPPSFQILRRPTNDNPKKGAAPGANAAQAKTLSEREEVYRMARERIFAEEEKEKEKAYKRLEVQPPSRQSSRSPAVGGGKSAQGVLRQPRGPGEGGGFRG